MAQRNEIALDQNRNGHIAKKFTCPGCGKKKRFVRYYDYTAGDYLEEKYGRCDREQECGYFEAPYAELKAKYQDDAAAAKAGQQFVRKFQKQPEVHQVIKPVDKQVVKTTLNFYNDNNLTRYLYTTLGQEATNEIISRYYIGTGRDGATIFWQLDKFMRVRTGQRILYGDNGKRRKDVPPKRLFRVDEGYTPCLFGEHLLFTIGDKYPVAIVESEKTAALCSAFLPTLGGQPVLWMAAGGSNGLTDEKIKVLAGMSVILVPDFSFHARATWGQTPMRKLKNERGQQIPHPDGELITDYEPASKRLQAIGCTVRFYDPAPHITDGSDIGDLVITQKPPTRYKKPDFDKYRIGQPKENAHNTPKTCPSLPERPTLDINILQGGSYFKIRAKENGQLSVHVEPEFLKPHIETLINHPNILKLVEKFDICDGILTPLQQ